MLLPVGGHRADFYEVVTGDELMHFKEPALPFGMRVFLIFDNYRGRHR